MMRLTLRDALATVLTAAAVAVFWALQAGFSLPLVASVRGAATAILVLGVAACVSGARANQPGRLSTALGSFGTIAFFAGLVAVIWASEFALAVETFVILGLWAVTTARHALTPPPVPPAYQPRQHTHAG